MAGEQAESSRGGGHFPEFSFATEEIAEVNEGDSECPVVFRVSDGIFMEFAGGDIYFTELSCDHCFAGERWKAIPGPFCVPLVIPEGPL